MITLYDYYFRADLSVADVSTKSVNIDSSTSGSELCRTLSRDTTKSIKSIFHKPPSMEHNITSITEKDIANHEEEEEGSI